MNVVVLWLTCALLDCSRTSLSDDLLPTGPGSSAGGVSRDASSDGSTTSGNDAGTASDQPGSALPTDPAFATAYGLTPGRTWSIVDPSLTPPLAPIWTTTLGGSSTIGYPLIAEGKVFFVLPAPGGSALVALDKATGTMVWGPVNLQGVQAPLLAYDGGRVFVLGCSSTEGCNLGAYDGPTGGLVWEVPLADTASCSASTGPPVAYRGIFYVTGESVTAIDERNGAVGWTQPNSVHGVESTIAVDDEGVYEAVTCSQSLNRFGGSKQWQQCAASLGNPAVASGRVYLGAFVLDEMTGNVLSTFTEQFLAVDDSTAIYSPGASAPGIEAVDVATGQTRWSHPLTYGTDVDGVAIAGGTVYMTTYLTGTQGTITGIDEKTGAVVWSADGAPRMSLTLGQGVLLTLSQMPDTTATITAHAPVSRAGQ